MTQETLQSFKFPWAGDPWVYNGTCLFFRYLNRLIPDEIKESFSDISWETKQGIVNAPSQERFVEFLNAVCDYITDHHYIKPRNYDILYNEESPLEDKFKKISRPAFTPFHRRLIKGLTARPIDGRKNQDTKVSVDKLSDEEKQELERFIDLERIEPREDKKDGKVVERYIFNTRWRFFIEPLRGYNWDNENKYQRCDFCGKHAPAKPISGLNHPLMTSTLKYQNFSSNLSSSPIICPYCATSSHFTSAFLPFLLRKETYFYAIPQFTDIKEGIDFWDLLTVKTRGEDFGDWSNFEIEPWYYDTTYHAFLALLAYVDEKFDEIRTQAKDEKELGEFADLSDQDLWRLKCKSWTTIYGEKEGNTFQPRIISHYHSTPKFYHLMGKLKREDIKLKTFVRAFTYERSKKDYIIRFKNELAKRILDFSSVNLTVESFLNTSTTAGAGHSIWGLSKFLKIYNTEVMQMKESEVNKAIYIGLRIGEYCREEGDRDLIYELRSCTNRTQFLEFLDRATFKIPELKVGKEFILSLTDDKWADQKSLVGIYAHQSFHERPKLEGGKENE